MWQSPTASAEQLENLRLYKNQLIVSPISYNVMGMIFFIHVFLRFLHPDSIIICFWYLRPLLTSLLHVNLLVLQVLLSHLNMLVDGTEDNNFCCFSLNFCISVCLLLSVAFIRSPQFKKHGYTKQYDFVCCQLLWGTLEQQKICWWVGKTIWLMLLEPDTFISIGLFYRTNMIVMFFVYLLVYKWQFRTMVSP